MLSEDIAFVGFDDIPAATQSTPPLSTVTVDKEALGWRGVELLLEDHPEQGQADSLVDVNFIPRASSPPRRDLSQI